VFPFKTAAGTVDETDYELYTLDAAGDLIELRRRDGVELDYSYDNLNRMTLKTVPERIGLPSTHTRDVYHAYDNLNRQTVARFDSLSGEGLSVGYDGLGRVVSANSTMGGVSRTLAYGYDTAGNRASLTYPGGPSTGSGQGFTVTSSYDGFNRLAQLSDTSSALVGFSYDAQGRRQSRTNYGGAAGTTSYSYDPDGPLAGMGTISPAPATTTA
jgi:YD repeat-containing protein